MSNSKLYYRLRRSTQDKVANGIEFEKKMSTAQRVNKYDPEIFNKGMEWFNSGLSLEDAPNDLKNNTNFIRGFEKGQRLSLVDRMTEHKRR